jgi:Kef-type K+ transport system membrane component KefB
VARLARLAIAAAVAVSCAPAALAAGGDEGTHGLVPAIGLAIVAAAVLAVVFHRLKQPALLAYIAAGLALGLFSDELAGAVPAMSQVAHLGLVFLLFIIGIEMDIAGILRLGPRAAVAILLQAPVSIAAVLAIQALAHAVGLRVPGLGEAPASWLTFAVAASLGSTAVVVKLLADKFDLSTQAGRVTVLTLIGQDVWAVLALSWVSAQGDGTAGHGGVLALLGGAALLAAACILLSHWVLPRVLARLSAVPDVLAVVALGWCFLWAEAFRRIGLSAEMGALFAGLTIGRLPQRVEIQAKVSSLRDFFMALFFVALGMSLPVPGARELAGAAMLVAIVVVTRLVLFSPALLTAGLGPIVSFAVPVNIAQISEFSLLLVPIGIAQGALSAADGSVISYALMLSVVLSTYAIPANYRIAAALGRLAGRSGAAAGAPQAAGETGPGHAGPGDAAHGGSAPEIVFLGYFQNAEALARSLASSAPGLLPRILVIDYNLRNHERVRRLGMRVAYGDVANPDTLRHHGVAGAQVVVSTIADEFLRGITNAALLEQTRAINPGARFVATASSEAAARDLLARGAFACITPPAEAAEAYAQAIARALPGAGGAPDAQRM